MGLRFRRSLKLLPGVRLNLSRSGVSTSVGRRGLWFTVGPRGTRETIGVPGTGVSYTTSSPARRGGWLWLVLLAVVALAAFRYFS